jgi:hypothetical protein
VAYYDCFCPECGAKIEVKHSVHIPHPDCIFCELEGKKVQLQSLINKCPPIKMVGGGTRNGGSGRC